jgi:hypothetical protein
MFNRNHLLTLLIGLFVFSSNTGAQNQNCSSCPTKREKSCPCEPKKEEAPAQRLKPYAEYEPARDIAPRDLTCRV